MTTHTSRVSTRSGSAVAGSPDWVRVIGLVWLPIGLAGVPIAYSLA